MKYKTMEQKIEEALQRKNMTVSEISQETGVPELWVKSTINTFCLLGKCDIVGEYVGLINMAEELSCAPNQGE